MRKAIFSAAVLIAWVSSGFAAPLMQITEVMYNGLGTGNIGEYVEFTNMDTVPIDMTGWSFDDSSRVPGSQSLSAFGTVQPGESVIFTDDAAATFRTRWNLPASVKIIGGNGNNLSSNDEVNLFSGPNAITDLVDRLTWTSFTPGVARGPNSDAVLGTNAIANWTFMVFPSDGSGDPHLVGTVKNTTAAGEIGNPGSYVPEPGSMSLLLAASLLSAKRRRA